MHNDLYIETHVLPSPLTKLTKSYQQEFGSRSEVPCQLESHQVPRISIVTPSYMQGAFIESTIRSVLLQGYPNLQFIVMDGGSTDDTLAILNHYDRWISSWTSAPDGGQSQAINQGIEKSDGDFVGWLCSDDLLTSGALVNMGRYLVEHPSCQWISGAGRFVSLAEGDQEIFEAGIQSETSLLEYWLYGFKGHFLPQPSTLWTRSLWERAGGLRESNRWSMDYELWLRFEELADLDVLPGILSVSQLHEFCKSESGRHEQRLEMMQCAHAAAERRGLGEDWLSRHLLKKWLIRWRAARARRALLSGEPAGLFQELFQLLRSPWYIRTEEGRLSALGWDLGARDS
ncbi:MAG: glycosyltransferase family 2 protein [Planctomycetota bacterium]